MKIYQIASKQYAVSGDNLYEQVPEFSPLASLVDDTVTDVEVAHVTRTAWSGIKKKKKQVHNHVSKKTYQRGTCGRCGKEGHSAWHCPDRPETKGAKKQKEKDAKVKKHLDRVAGKMAARINEVVEADDRSDEDLGGEVHRLQQDGLDSLQIASKLKLRISKVNQLWDPDIAQVKAEEEEGGEIV